MQTWIKGLAACAALALVQLTFTADQTIPELAWVPEDAKLILVLDRPKTNPGLFARFSSEILFATETIEPIRHFSEGSGRDLLETAERIVIGIFKRGETPETLGIIRGNSGDLATMQGGHVGTETLDSTHVAFGTAPVLDHVKALYKGAKIDSILKNKPIASSLLDPSLSPGLRGVALPDWFGFQFTPAELEACDLSGRSVNRSLGRIRSTLFSAAFSDVVRFRLRTDALDAPDADILADALRGQLASLRQTAKSTAPREVQEVMNTSRVQTAGSRVDLEMIFTAPAMERIRNNVASKKLVRWQLEDSLRERTQREILDLLNLSDGQSVADIGAGLGFYAVRLARAVGPKGRVYAVDIDASSLEQLRLRFSEGRWSQVRVIAGESDNPRLPTDSLDAALIMDSYHEMTEHQRMLDEIRKAMKPGGRLLISERISAKLLHSPRQQQVKEHLISREIVEGELSQAGFEITARNDEFLKMEDQILQWILVCKRPAM